MSLQTLEQVATPNNIQVQNARTEIAGLQGQIAEAEKGSGTGGGLNLASLSQTNSAYFNLYRDEQTANILFQVYTRYMEELTIDQMSADENMDVIEPAYVNPERQYNLAAVGLFGFCFDVGCNGGNLYIASSCRSPPACVMNGVPAIEVSVVIPTLNEAENAVAIAAAATAALVNADATYEIIFIDNGSTDGTVDVVKALCLTDQHIRLIVNNQNYGQMRSPTYGIYQASGEAVIGLCADFQDPPEMIGEFIARWRAGAEIVLGVRVSERTSMVLRFIRLIGYGFFERFGDYRVIPNATGFGLYSRRVVEILKRWRGSRTLFPRHASGERIQSRDYSLPPTATCSRRNQK